MRLRLPSPLDSDVGSLRLGESAMNIANAEYQSIVGHGRSGQDEGYFAREPSSRASFSSTLAENGSIVCLASDRVVERERVLNNRVQAAVETAEESLVELLRLVARVSGVGLGGVQDEVLDSMAQGTKASIASLWHGQVHFTVENYPEDRDPIRPGTPGLSLDDYLADDEQESAGASRRKTARYSGRLPLTVPSSAMLEPLQSPIYVLRALKPSEFWDEYTPAEPVLHAPAPLRPLRELESLIARYNGMTEAGKEPE